ncbi:uncharacterized protein ColSpa_05610 [Colletotrichum spaethianum]|uniref:Uncharacterized protein n=1 Tax=Colletotrichum spaethianum TaxID=700344 RepID=A0AA37LDK9_9PEZI|nr:uncharacterized protein ColSpa_05610 [Colletotrichum spaethianum]GKT45429.1 hypothetical protein ColSpa_05610 [Colletotrichum spaethianum]
MYPTYRSKFGPKYVLDPFHDPPTYNSATERDAETSIRRKDARTASESSSCEYPSGVEPATADPEFHAVPSFGFTLLRGGMRFGIEASEWRKPGLPNDRVADNCDYQDCMLTFDDSGTRAAGFGAAAGIAALFYTSGIPRIQRDILMKIPVIGQTYVKDIPPSDNTLGKQHGRMVL